MSHSTDRYDSPWEVEARKFKVTGDKERERRILSMPFVLASFPSHRSRYSLTNQYYDIPPVELMRESMGITFRPRQLAGGMEGEKSPTPIVLSFETIVELPQQGNAGTR